MPSDNNQEMFPIVDEQGNMGQSENPVDMLNSHCQFA